MSSTTATASKPKGWIVATAVASCLAVAGIVTAAVIGVSGPAHADAATAPAQSSTSTSGQYQPSNGGGFSPAQGPNHRPVTPTAPSAAMKMLQQQLAQLNYYNGPITGYENTQTVNAITYLQRDAHLPQTGQLNGATRAAMNSMLVHGNNQMGG